MVWEGWGRLKFGIVHVIGSVGAVSNRSDIAMALVNDCCFVEKWMRTYEQCRPILFGKWFSFTSSFW